MRFFRADLNDCRVIPFRTVLCQAKTKRKKDDYSEQSPHKDDSFMYVRNRRFFRFISNSDVGLPDLQ
jgi:hypothetical protein